MKKFCLIFLLFLPVFIFGQNSKSIITINANSKIAVPADLIKFHISFGVKNQDPETAFKKHKILEKKLLQIIKKFNIPDSSIEYSLLSISKSNRDLKKILFKTNQTVTIVIANFKNYYPIQIELLKNGFYEFSARFSSSHIFDAQKQGYKIALNLARSNANEIAKQLGKKLGSILSVETSVSNLGKNYYSGSNSIKVPPSFVDIKQTIDVFTRLKVQFGIE